LKRAGTSLDGVVLLSADFRRDDAAAALAAAGHDAGRPTLFICEGLLIYLDEETNVALLHALRSCAAPGSRLAASLATHPDGEDSREVVAAANRIRRNSAREPWRTILTVDGQIDLLARAGWSVDPAERWAAVRGLLLVLARA
jgi:methyltransferase (TIGR00027 family)